MSRTIEELQSMLEELEKRIKAISNAQTLHQQLSALDLYFSDIKDYLEDIKDIVSSCNSGHTTLTSNLTTLSDSLSSLAQRVVALEEGGASDEAISSLEDNISAIETAIITLKGGSNTTIAALEQNISDIQTDLGYLGDDVDDLEDEISDINTSLGSIQTTINNLSSTQNTLTTSQGTLTSTVNSINNRLTAAESNINDLTGGVNLTEYDNRLSSLEDQNTWKNHHVYKIYNYGCKTRYRIFKPPFIDLHTNLDGEITVKIKLKYTSTENTTGNFAFKISRNGTIVSEQSIDSESGINECEFIETFLPGTELHRYSVNVNTLLTNNDIVFDSIEFEAMGNGVEILNQDRNLEVRCAGDKIAVVNYANNPTVSYSIYDRVDLDNISTTTFTNTIPVYDQTDNVYYIHTKIEPYGYFSNNELKQWTFGLYRYNSNMGGILGQVEPIQTSYSALSGTQNNANEQVGTFSGMLGGIYSLHCSYEASQSTFTIRGILVNSSIAYSLTSATGETMPAKWAWTKPLQNNNADDGMPYTNSGGLCPLVALNANGYIYYFMGSTKGKAVKLGRGNYANAYLETDGTVNVYVSDNYSTTKFKLTLEQANASNLYNPSYLVTSSESMNYSAVFELYDNKLLAQNPTTRGWSVITKTY